MEGMMASQYALVRTKYSKPAISPWLISRNRLSEKLNKVIDHKLTVMVALAGYGKSTAVNEWLKSSGIPYAWVSLDEGDNDPVVFWKYVCAALDGIFLVGGIYAGKSNPVLLSYAEKLDLSTTKKVVLVTSSVSVSKRSQKSLLYVLEAGCFIKNRFCQVYLYRKI